MIAANESKAVSLDSKQQPHMRFNAHLIRELWIIPGATVFIALLFYSLGYLILSRAAQHILAIFIYSTCIGLLSMVFLTWISFRYKPRFPRAIVLIQALCLVATASVGSIVAGLIIWAVGLTPRPSSWDEYLSSLLFSIVITLVFGLSIASYQTLQYRLQATEIELRNQQVEQERANKLVAEARLSSLESSIHPHFLFNTLNSIAALIPTDPKRAEDIVGKLASLLRYSLNGQHNRLAPLEQELKLVRDYLEIENTRFGRRLRYEILVPDSLNSVKVPPLSLQTLVENVVKHVAATRVEGASIQVKGQIESQIGDRTAGHQAGQDTELKQAKHIRLEVIDDGPGFSPGQISPEHGLGNLVARLELLFGDNGRLSVLREQEKTIVRISFPAES
jgi:sensor histidine kinase YesM